MSGGSLILYRRDDDRAEVQLRLEGESFWLSQAEMADLFRTMAPNIYIRNIFKENELGKDAVIKEFLITAADSNGYRTKLYRLDHVGSVSTEQLKAIAHERYETFDARRRSVEAPQANAEDLKVEAIDKKPKSREAGK